MNPIHKKALEVAARFRQAEADLISILQEVETRRVFVRLGYTSLFNYCVQALGLSESVTSNFVTVARKAREVPVLQSAIQSGALSVSKARKITPVLTLDNQDEWVEKARSLTTRKLEEEIARAAHAVSLEETLETLLDVYLESKDPLKRAERVMKRKAVESIGESNGDSGNRATSSPSPR